MNFVEEQEEIKANIAIIPNVIEADFILTLDNIFTNSTKLIFIMFEKPCKDTKKTINIATFALSNKDKEFFKLIFKPNESKRIKTFTQAQRVLLFEEGQRARHLD